MENAKLYSSSNGMQKKDAREILLEFGDKITWRRGGRVLDVGCGSGEVTTEIILPQLPKDFDELVGLDVSLDMIQHARNLHSHFKVKFVQLDIAQSSDNILDEITDILQTPKTNNDSYSRELRKFDSRGKTDSGFDVVFSFYCLHWVPDQKLALKNINECLRPGGEALLVFLAKSPIFTLYRELSKEIHWKEYMQDVDSFIPFYQDSECPAELFEDLVKRAGFMVLEMNCREKHYTFESFSSLRNAIIAVNPFLSRIPEVLREDYIQECLYLTQILKLAAFKNSCYHVKYKLMIAHIRKPEL